jgi:hypothetical protein
MVIKIVKFQQYPADNPTGIAVGFKITFENDRSEYIDTVVDLDLTEDEAIAAAWDVVKDTVDTMKETTGALPKIVGTIFTPPATESFISLEDLPGPGVIQEVVEEVVEVVEEESVTEEVIDEIIE